jgi:subtilase family serine protease
MFYNLYHYGASKENKKEYYESIFEFCFSITGLTAIVTKNCSDKDPYVEKNLAWTDYINPCVLLILYFYFTFETNQTFSQRVNFITN